jgi:hypothetical protein
VHVLLGRDAGQIDTLPLGPLVHIYRLTSAPGRSLMTLRPDGYIGLHCQTADVNQLCTWLAQIGVTTSGPIGLGRSPPPSRPHRRSVGLSPSEESQAIPLPGFLRNPTQSAQTEGGAVLWPVHAGLRGLPPMIDTRVVMACAAAATLLG